MPYSRLAYFKSFSGWNPFLFLRPASAPILCANLYGMPALIAKARIVQSPFSSIPELERPPSVAFVFNCIFIFYDKSPTRETLPPSRARQLGDQFKPDNAIQSEPTDVIHSRDIAGDSLASRRVDTLVLFIEELSERTGNMILLRLKAIRLCLVDDAVGLAQSDGISNLGEQEVEV